MVRRNLIFCLMMVAFLAACSTSDAIIGDDFVLVRAKTGEESTNLADRWLGSRALAWRIDELNGSIKEGDMVLIPKRDLRPSGISPQGVEGVIILSYHHIKDEKNCRGTTVCVQDFRDQIDYMVKNGIPIISLQTFTRHFQNGERLPPNAVVLTFDDGWKSTYDYAFPILEEYGLPATVFVYTDFVSAPAGLTWDQLKEMEAGGIFEVQSHSRTHSNLPKVLATLEGDDKAEFLEKEIGTPNKIFARKMGGAPYAFAYPYGAANGEVTKVVAEQNLKIGLTVTRGPVPMYADRLKLRRTMIFGEDSLADFKRKIKSRIELP